MQLTSENTICTWNDFSNFHAPRCVIAPYPLGIQTLDPSAPSEPFGACRKDHAAHLNACAATAR